MEDLVFSARPGAHERHLQRRYRNPLFGDSGAHFDYDDLLLARAADAQEEACFLKEWNEIVNIASQLDSNVESETILALKARLDRAYTIAAGLRGDHRNEQQAMVRLIAVIMRAVRFAAAGDSVAAEELAQEEAVRKRHHEFLRFPLVTDLLRPDSPVRPEELPATLLSAEPEALVCALWAFEDQMVAEIIQAGEAMVARLQSRGQSSALAEENLQRMRNHLSGAIDESCYC
jgi:hypothetical protein